MKKILAVIAMVFMMAIAGNASAVVLDFEGLNGSLPDPYQGIIDWEDGSWFVYDWSQPPFNPHSGTGRTYESTADSTPSWSFLTDVVYDGSFFSGYSDATVQMDLYLNGAIVHSTGVFAPSAVSTFFPTGYTGLADMVVINTPRPDYWVMDDLTYNTVPEPSTLLLLGSGLIGLGYFGRKRMKRK